MAFRFYILLLTFTVQVNIYADSWNDPEWYTMLESSDLIAKITYLENGEFMALAHVSLVYEGVKSSDTILVSGFSNRYGPIDSVQVGDSFIAFLRKAKWSDERIKYYEEDSQSDLTAKKLLTAYMNGALYYVWSPTSGDYHVDNDSVSISFKSTTYWDGKDKHLLTDIEEFLHRRTDKEYHKEIITRISNSSDTAIIVTELFKLAYGKYDEFKGIFIDFSDWRSNEINYALSNLLRGIPTSESVDLLFKIFDDSNPILKGHIVESLNLVEVETLDMGERLSEKLHSTYQFDSFSGTLMNPIMNEYRGGGLQLIYSLAERKYSEDEEYIVNLVKEANNSSLFDAGVLYLDSIGSDRIPEILIYQLEKGNKELLYEVISLGAKRKYVEFLNPLMSYIDTFDRSEDRYNYYLFSTYGGIGSYEGKSVEDFIYKDVQRYLSNYRNLPSAKQKRYLEGYSELFAENRYVYSKDVLYEILESWYGLRRDFYNLSTLNKSLNELQNVRNILTDSFATDSLKILEILPVYFSTDTTNNSIGFDIRIEIKNDKPNIDSLRLIFMNNNFCKIEKAYFQRYEGYYYSGIPERFDIDNYEKIIDSFLKLVEKDLEKKDLDFIENITLWPLISNQERLVEKLLEFVEEHKE